MQTNHHQETEWVMTTEKKRRRTTWIKLGSGCGLLVILVLWTAGIFRSRIAGDDTVMRTPPPVPPQAPIVVASNQLLRSSVELAGTVSSQRTIHLSARLSAYVKEVTSSAGQRVEPGQRLMSLDDRDLQQQLNSAQAALAQADAQHTRTRTLHSKGAATDQQLEHSESAFKNATSQVARIRVMLSYTTITSPIAGIVTDRRIEVGDLAAPGQLLLAVYDPTTMRIEVPVPARLVPLFKSGKSVTVRLDHPHMELSGTVSEIVSEIDASTRTRLVKVSIATEGQALLPGTYGYVRIYGDEEAALLLPAAAIARAGQLEFVTLDQAGQAVRRLVKTIPHQSGAVQILSGIAAGDRVVIGK
jgi:membrane fusion protein (multidrug efflux system)